MKRSWWFGHSFSLAPRCANEICDCEPIFSCNAPADCSLRRAISSLHNISLPCLDGHSFPRSTASQDARTYSLTVHFRSTVRRVGYPFNIPFPHKCSHNFTHPSPPPTKIFLPHHRPTILSSLPNPDADPTPPLIRGRSPGSGFNSSFGSTLPSPLPAPAVVLFGFTFSRCWLRSAARVSS